jgi:hypothetical protein
MGARAGAAGGFLLVFGFLTLLIAPGIVYALYPNATDTNTAQVSVDMVAITVASLGAGLLFYGALSRGGGPRAEAPQAAPAEEAQVVT